MAHPYFRQKLQKAPKKKPQLNTLGPGQSFHFPPGAVTLPSGGGGSRGQKEIPGEVKMKVGENKGRYFKLLHNSRGIRQMRPRTDEPKIKMKGGGLGDRANLPSDAARFEIKRHPQSIESPEFEGVVDARKQSHKQLSNTHAQISLHHGIDFGRSQRLHVGSLTGSHAYMGTGTNHLGQKVIIKQSLPQETMEEMNVFNPDFSSAHRETLYHNMARDFFKMGHYVPPTSTFSHGGEDFSSMEWTHDHVPDSDSDTSHKRMMSKLERSGELHKLGMMNIILGNSDRHGGNYLVGKNGIKLIDHGLTFDYKNTDRHYKLGYLSDHHSVIPDHVRQWVKKMSPIRLAAMMKKNGSPRSITVQAIKNLATIKKTLREDPSATMNDVLTEANVDMG